MGSFTDIAGSIPGIAGSIIGILGILIAYAALRTSQRGNRILLVNSVLFETYKLYSSPEVLRGRQVAREIERYPDWNQVADYSAYVRFFTAHRADLAALGTGLQDPEQDLHYLLGYYHQVGVLIQGGFLNADFAIMLLGQGMMDRWNVVGRVPTLFPGDPYPGVYVLYSRYQKWAAERPSTANNDPSKAVRDAAVAEVRAGKRLS